MHLILKTIQIRLEMRFATGEAKPPRIGELRKRIAMRECPKRARREKCIPFVSINVSGENGLKKQLELIALAKLNVETVFYFVQIFA